MVNMARSNRLFDMLLMGAVLAATSLAQAQEPAYTPPPAPTGDAPAAVQPAQDADLAAQVQQLRTDIDQLQNQVARLSSIVEQLQADHSEAAKVTGAEPAKATGSTRAKKTPSSPAPKKTAGVTPAPAITPETDEKTSLTVLVFTDGHRVEARNYAIVGQTLWIYTDQDSKKVPLADLDVNATKNANSDRGIVFQVPATK